MRALTPEEALIASPSMPQPMLHAEAFKPESQVLSLDDIFLIFNLSSHCWARGAPCSDLLGFFFFRLEGVTTLPGSDLQQRVEGGT